MPPLRRNIIASYVSQLLVAALGIVAMPLYFAALSAESYGLIGFFVVLQTWFNLLDLGLSPSVAREAARYRGNSLPALDFRILVRALELLFLVIALLAGGALFLAAGVIADEWLGVSALPHELIVLSLELMAITVALRWVAGLYRGIVTGFERLVWLGGFNLFIGVLRFVGPLPVLWYYSATPTAFLGYQVGVAIIELAWIAWVAHRQLPAPGRGVAIPLRFAPVITLMRFSALVALSGVIGSLLTQTDKLILSKILPLADYGQFSLAVIAANGVLLLGLPIGSAIMPRMAKLESEGSHGELIALYRSATRTVAVLSGAVTATMIAGAYPLLYLWTGDAALARTIARVFALYTLGNGLMTIAAFPYYLQYAKGDLRLHITGNILFAVILVPVIIVTVNACGMVGAGIVWAMLNAATLFAWLPFVHARFEPGLNKTWYMRDVAGIIVPTGLVGTMAWWLMADQPTPLLAFAQLALTACATLAIGLIASPDARNAVRRFRSNA